MSGFRKESFYIEKYGEIEGKKKYQHVLDQRESRSHRRTTSGPSIKCMVCGGLFKRITRSHLLNSCIDRISTSEYLQRFPNATLVSPELKKLYSNTKDSIVSKYGITTGEKKWKEYCEVQALTNTFEYKAEKYNMSNDEFASYNKNRATTLENFIIRHGEELGLNKWNEYCDRQKYTTSIAYFIEKYGYDEGTLKYHNFCAGRSMVNKIQSAIELEVYDELRLVLTNLELSVILDNPHYGPYDYGNLDFKKLIEFYGTYWHADPRFYDSDHILTQKNQTSSQIQARDRAKQTYATNRGYKVYVIWEHDWRKNKQQTITNILRWWNEN